jgi:hypothetical protein
MIIYVHMRHESVPAANIRVSNDRAVGWIRAEGSLAGMDLECVD